MDIVWVISDDKRKFSANIIRIASSVSNDPVLHFVIFVPSANRRPLRILDSEGDEMAVSNYMILVIHSS